MSGSSRTMRAGYFAFTAALGVAGWALLMLAASRALGPEPVARPDLSALILFGIVIVAGCTAAVRTAEGQVLALDGAFYVAAAVCVGSVLAGGLVALALSVDAGVRLVRARRDDRAKLGWWGGLCYVVFFGGATGALVLVVGWLFRLDELYVLVEGTDLVVLTRLLIAGGVLVAAHYALQAVRVFLSGDRCSSIGVASRFPG